jgi:L-ascorbate metabolism protein UlaG (beta-lactamase superfamily)
MAEVKLRGKALLDDIAAAPCPAGTLCFWWLGQASWIFKGGNTVIYIDPYLWDMPERQTPPALKAEEVTNADIVICTHDHLDHIDPVALPIIMKASQPRGARVIIPRVHRKRVGALDISESQIVGVNAGETVNLAGAEITAIKAKHEFFDEQPEGFPYLGYVIRLNGVNFLHPGDTVYYDGYISTLQRFGLDIMFMPINGRDGKRYRAKIIGNFTFQEAVDITGEVQPKLAVPMHYDMFAINSEDPQKFVDYLHAKYGTHIKTWIGAAGERVTFRTSP